MRNKELKIVSCKIEEKDVNNKIEKCFVIKYEKDGNVGEVTYSIPKFLL